MAVERFSPSDPRHLAHMPATLGHYEILREIACGGMATVYLARELTGANSAKFVALKCCHPHLRRDPAFAAMFLDEARLAARIHHPNVVETLDIGETDPLYFAMEYIDGTSLAEWLKQSALDPSRKLRVELLLRIVLDALNGLHAAHELRDESGQPLHLIHRDVSPQNLLIGFDGITRIADFGIAKAEKRATRTRSGQVKGKTGYMPPEQILGERIDRRADVYAAGVVLWEALVGRRLFDGESDAAVINQVLNGRVAAPSTLSSAPEQLDPIVEKALRFRADERFSSALEFANSLRATGLEIAPVQAVGAALGSWLSPGELHRTVLLEQTAARRPKRHAVLLLVLFAVALASLALWVRTWNRTPSEPRTATSRESEDRSSTPIIVDSSSVKATRLEPQSPTGIPSAVRGRSGESTQNTASHVTPRASTIPMTSAVRLDATSAPHSAATASASPTRNHVPNSSALSSPNSKPAEFRPPDL